MKNYKSKTIEFVKNTTGHIGLVNGVVVWFIRQEKQLEPKGEWMVYRSENNGESFLLIPAECVRDEEDNIDFGKPHKFGFTTLENAKCFVYGQSLRKGE